MDVPNRIKEWRTRFGLTYASLGELVGTTAPQIQKLERGERGLDIKWMVRISTALSSVGQGTVFPADLLPHFGQHGPRQHALLPTAGGQSPGSRELIPVYTAVAENDENLVLLEAPIGHTTRPPILQNATDGYALQMAGISMMPRYSNGQVLYIDPTRPPREGNGVVVRKPGNAVVIAEFRRFLPDRGLALRTYQPSPHEFEIQKTAYQRLHTVVGTEEV